MEKTCNDLLDEYRSLAELCDTLEPGQWALRTDFYGWTPWDESARLSYFDETARPAATDPAALASRARAPAPEPADGLGISPPAARKYGHLGGANLPTLWRERFETLVSRLRPLDPKARLPWYGPTRSARAFATARLMECWAHGQDIWDVLGRSRGP